MKDIVDETIDELKRHGTKGRALEKQCLSACRVSMRQRWSCGNQGFGRKYPQCASRFLRKAETQRQKCPCREQGGYDVVERTQLDTVTDTWCMSTSTLLRHPFLSWSLQVDLKVLHGSRKKRAVNHHGHRNTCNHIYRISPEPVTILRQTWTPSSPPSQPSRQIQHGPISGCKAIVRFGCQATRRVTARTRQP